MWSAGTGWIVRAYPDAQRLGGKRLRTLQLVDVSDLLV